jgi:hypothetical protein
LNYESRRFFIYPKGRCCELERSCNCIPWPSRNARDRQVETPPATREKARAPLIFRQKAEGCGDSITVFSIPRKIDDWTAQLGCLKVALFQHLAIYRL